jgi:hypothetical protein
MSEYRGCISGDIELCKKDRMRKTSIQPAL